MVLYCLDRFVISTMIKEIEGLKVNAERACSIAPKNAADSIRSFSARSDDGKRKAVLVLDNLLNEVRQVSAQTPDPDRASSPKL